MADRGPAEKITPLSSIDEVFLESLERDFNDIKVEVPQLSPALLAMRAAGVTYGTHFWRQTKLPTQPGLVITDFEGINAATGGSRVIEAILIDGEHIRHYGIDDVTGDVMLIRQEYAYEGDEGSKQIVHDALTPPHITVLNPGELQIFSGAAYRQLFRRRAPGVRLLSTTPDAAKQLQADLATFDDDGVTRISPHSVTWGVYQAEVTPMDALMIDIDS